MVKEPEADNDGGTYGKDPNNIVREDFGEKIDSLKAEKVAADWEDGPWKSSKPFKGVTNPVKQ